MTAVYRPPCKDKIAGEQLKQLREVFMGVKNVFITFAKVTQKSQGAWSLCEKGNRVLFYELTMITAAISDRLCELMQ